MIFLPFIIALFVFAYHYERNGDPLTIGNTLERLFWAVCFGLGAALLSSPHFHYYALGWLTVGALLEIYIPHGFAQNMGDRTQTWDAMPRITVFGSVTLPKWWPAIWMAPFKDKLGFTTQDFLGMGTVGLIRGLIVFAPTLFLGCSLVGVLFATALATIWQPLSYWVGYRTPFTLWTNTANSSTWGEFYVPIGWALALAGLLWL